MTENSQELLAKTLLSAEELAEHLQVSVSMAYTIMRTGEIPVVKIGRCVRVRQEDVNEYIRRNTWNGYDFR